MSDKELISVRLHTDTKSRVEAYAEEHDVSRSVAIRRLLNKGADLEEAGLTVAASHKSENSSEKEKEEEIIADGSGTVRSGLLNSAVLALFFTIGSWIFSIFSGSLPGLAFTYSGLTVFAINILLLRTSFPEMIDRHMVERNRRKEGVLS